MGQSYGSLGPPSAIVTVVITVQACVAVAGSCDIVYRHQERIRN